jgi:acyl dehydratase
MAQLGRLVTDWAGQDNVTALSTRFTAITPVNATVTCEGTVSDTVEKDGETLLKLTLSAKIDDGTQTLKGEALVRIA